MTNKTNESDVEKSVVSAEEVLDNLDETYYDEGIATVSYDTAVKAMQEYASQFTTQSPAKGYSVEDMEKCFNEGMVAWANKDDLPTPRVRFQTYINSLKKT